MCCTKHKINIYSICIAFLLALVTLLPSFSSIHSYITLAAETQTQPEYAGALSAYMFVSEPGYTYYSYNATTNTYTDSTDVFVTTKTVDGHTINVYTIYTTTNITLTQNEKGTETEDLTYDELTSSESASTRTSSESDTSLFPENKTQTTIYAPNNTTIQAKNANKAFFEIQIVFVDVYTYSTNSYTWATTNISDDTSSPQPIDQPENDAVFEYKKLTLELKNTEEQMKNNNHLYVKYTLNGTTYIATYSNTSTDESETLTDEVVEATKNIQLNFEDSGNYIVEIYDDTYTPEAQASGKRTNYKKYTFSVENGVYALTYSPENEEQYFIDNQYTNTDVIVSLKGTQESDVYYFKAVNQENLEDVYVEGTLQNSNNFSYTFSQHGNYVVTIYTDQAYTQSILESEFHIVKELVTTLIFDEDQSDTTLEITNDEGPDDTNTHVQIITTTVKQTQINKNIQTVTTYTFTYRYAYSNAIPSFVSNVGNNQRTSGSVTVRPQTTGNFVVQITYNGTTHLWEYNPKDAESLSRTFDAIGTYSLRLTDELGRSITFNFEIYKPMDAASITLIVVSCVIAVAIIIAIIVARTRLNVR